MLQNDSVATLLARLEGILGPLPRWMLHRGRYAHKYFLRDGRVFEKNPHTVSAHGLLLPFGFTAVVVARSTLALVGWLPHLCEPSALQSRLYTLTHSLPCHF